MMKPIRPHRHRWVRRALQTRTEPGQQIAGPTLLARTHVTGYWYTCRCGQSRWVMTIATAEPPHMIQLPFRPDPTLIEWRDRTLASARPVPCSPARMPTLLTLGPFTPDGPVLRLATELRKACPHLPHLGRDVVRAQRVALLALQLGFERACHMFMAREHAPAGPVRSSRP